MTAVPRVAGLLLAAGAGRRFGGPKAVVEVDGERLVDRAARVLAEAAVSPVVVVSGATPLVVAGAEVVHNEAWDEGIGSSLRTGLRWLSDRTSADAVVVVLVDQPGIGPHAVRRLLGSGSDPATLAVATYAGRRSHPVLLGRDHWPGIVAAAVGDVGARGYLAGRSDVREVACEDVADDTDLDTPEDVDHARIRWPDGGRVPH
jgi:CTP:molybdopterin cytidylyltransferase MocA